MADEDFPRALYTPDQLLAGYDRDDELGYTRSWDFGVFRRFVMDGGASPKTLDIRLRQARHDAYMADALRTFLDEAKPKLVGIMGGHAIKRGDEAYRAIAHLARTLTRADYLIVTGGGPGAMEAAHVGATFAHDDDAALPEGLALLTEVPGLPDLSGVITNDGDIAPGQDGKLRDARLWMNAALDAKAVAKSPGKSLAVPTWLYGQEPTVPFASHYAKYFQNSIREETLVLNSRAGIVYARGGGGTVREVFEDAESNYYAKGVKAFTPMIFFDPDGYWQRNAVRDAKGKVVQPGLNLEDIIIHMVEVSHGESAQDYLRKVAFTTDEAQILGILDTHDHAALENMMTALRGEPLEMLSTPLNYNRLARLL